MKNLIYLFLLALIIGACQPTAEKQYFTESPEIEIAKKTNEAYMAGDWETIKSYFADSAFVYFNSTEGITSDQYVGGLQQSVANYSKYGFLEDANYEMIVTDNGQKWVHAWLNWEATTVDGKDVKTLVTINWGIENDKIFGLVVIYNALPMYLAANPPSTPEIEADSITVDQ